MAKRILNPLGYDKKSGVKPPKPKAKKQRRTRDEIERQERILLLQYKERAKRMRGFFGDGFKPKDGYDLRKIRSWTPAQKAKVTRYFRVIAPRITGDFVVRRYRIPANRDAAIRASLQEEFLPGQTAVAFSVDPGEKLEVKIKDGRSVLKRGGIRNVELIFDKGAFLDDPDKEIDRVLKETNANVFRIIVGGQKQNKTLKRADIKDEIFSLIRQYAPENIRRDQNQKPFDEWLNGLVAYAGEEKKTYTKIHRYVEKHVKIMAQKERTRLDILSAERQGITLATYRRRRTMKKKSRVTRRGLGKRVR